MCVCVCVLSGWIGRLFCQPQLHAVVWLRFFFFFFVPPPPPLFFPFFSLLLFHLLIFFFFFLRHCFLLFGVFILFFIVEGGGFFYGGSGGGWGGDWVFFLFLWTSVACRRMTSLLYFIFNLSPFCSFLHFFSTSVVIHWSSLVRLWVCVVWGCNRLTPHTYMWNEASCREHS